MNAKRIKLVVGTSALAGITWVAACTSKDAEIATPDPGNAGAGHAGARGDMVGLGGASVAAGGASAATGGGSGEHAGAAGAVANGGAAAGVGGTAAGNGASGMSSAVGGAAGNASANAGAGGGDGGSTAVGGIGGSAGHPPHVGCRNDLPGPALVDVSQSAGVGFCMDATLVTAGQYQDFLNAKAGDTSGQPAGCQWNTTFAPKEDYPDAPPFTTCPGLQNVWQPDVHPEWIMPCTDYCDAVAYCNWAGKRLCGYLTGAEPYPDFQPAQDTGQYKTDAPARMELTYACTQGGVTAYHYGADFQASAGVELGADPASVTKSAGTIPPFDQLSGFNGEVSEWEGGCDLATTQVCGIRGTVYGDSTTDNASLERCDARSYSALRGQSPSFRCCTD